ncbi:DNA-directed RNA polymerase subunit alpha [Trichonephila clavipes]|nr:DNA-directed RNA polymerase subunit alpha [Trichonephila clavipes]
MRNLVLSRNDKLCFSTEAFPTCEDNAKPNEKEEKDVGFVCYSLSDPIIEHLLTDSSKRILTELNSRECDFTETVKVARC